jgi:hypothetical protein
VLGKAQEIEKAVYANMGGATPEYKSRIRSLFVNLKDKANPGLRASIVEGSLSPEKFSTMTSQVGFSFFFAIYPGADVRGAGNGLRRTKSGGQEDPRGEFLQVALGSGETGGDRCVPVLEVQTGSWIFAIVLCDVILCSNLFIPAKMCVPSTANAEC